MSRRYSKNKKIQKNIAKKRIEHLFELSERYALSNRFELSNRYVQLARKISMKYLVPIPKKYKRSFCKHCYSYLLPGINSRVRISRGKIISYCFECKKFTRFPLREKISSENRVDK